MYTLSGHDILHIWEVGLAQHSLDRALTILAACVPNATHAELARLSIGQRDTYLLRLYAGVFGPRLMGQADCPACRHAVEFALNIEALLASVGPTHDNQPQQATCDGYALTFRLPNSVDLAALVGCATVEEARQTLVQRCLLHVTRDSVDLATNAVSDACISALADQMAQHDPLAEIDLAMRCPECSQQWSVLLDIVIFLWHALATQARRLLHDVHSLAQAYGWSETAILNMSTARRQFYLEMVG